MRYFAGFLIALYAFVAAGQDAPVPSIAPVAPVMTPKITIPTVVPATAVPFVAAPAKAPAEAGPQATATPDETAQTPATPSTPAPADNVSTGATETAKSETNAPPAPVKDPAKCVIARLSFDNNLQPDVGGSTIPVTFKRLSASYLDGLPVNENLPRFTDGRVGRAVLIESAYANLFSIGQACAGELSAFKAVQGVELSISPDPGFAKGYAEASQPWQGKEALTVATKGENSEEGFSVEAPVERAFYTKENAAIVPAYYLASLYLKGQGNVKLTLKDVESGVSSEPVYVDLPANWQRFSCVFWYAFNRINIGANHETDWKNSLPPGTNIASHLQLVCTTVDSQKLNFFADGLQLEQRNGASGKNAEIAPHSWVFGAFQTAQEQLTIDVKNDYFNSWKKTGSIAFWFKPMWEARDNSNEIILQITKNQLLLAHDRQKMIFSPAGVSFTPYDWKNNWHHMVVTWNAAGERALYVDGMDYPNTAGEAKPIKDPESIMAGDFTRNLSPNGALDELIFYNITLTSEQAKALAAAEPAKPEATQSTGDAPAPAATAVPAVSTPAATEQIPSDKQSAQEETEEE